jgi:CAAX protease family protein
MTSSDLLTVRGVAQDLPDPRMNDVPFHRLARGRGWWRPLVEAVLAVVLWFVAAVVFAMPVFAVSGAKKLAELDSVTKFALTTLMLIALIPAALATVSVFGRRPGTLVSVTGRLRGRWFARCALAAFAVEAAWAAFIVVLHLVTAGPHGFRVPDRSALLGFAVLVSALVPFQAAAEELAFRGLLQQTIGAYIRPVWVAMVGSSVAFMLVHGAPTQASITLVLMGLAYAWLTYQTGGIEAAIARHAMSNIFTSITVAATRGLDHISAIEINNRLSWLGAAISCAKMAAYLAIVNRMWRRSAQGALARPDQLEEDAAERRVRVEHAASET